MKKLFSESWEGTSIIKRYLRLLINGRQVKVRFLNALEMEDIFEDRESPEKILLKTERLLRGRFRKNKQAILGLDVSHRRNWIKTLVNSKEINKYKYIITSDINFMKIFNNKKLFIPVNKFDNHVLIRNISI